MQIKLIEGLASIGCYDLVGFGGIALRATIGTVSAALQARDDNMELAVALNLPFQTVKEIAFKFSYLSATKTCHVNMISLRPPFVEVLFSLHVHQVKLVHQPMAL